MVFGTKKRKRNLIVADQTSRITVLLYEQLIDLVKEGNSYLSTNLSSRLYRNEFYVTTTHSTRITLIDDLEDVPDSLLTVETTTIQGSVSQVQCSVNTKCPGCDKTVLVQPDATTVKCNSCRLKARVYSLKKLYFFRMNIQDDQNVHRLVCFRTPMEDFLESTGNRELLTNMDQLEDYILSIDKIEVTVAKDSDVISSIKQITA